MNNAFNDATCSKCGCHIGWFGALVDRPPCPDCGDVFSLETLRADEITIEKARLEILHEMRKRAKKT